MMYKNIVLFALLVCTAFAKAQTTERNAPAAIVVGVEIDVPELQQNASAISNIFYNRIVSGLSREGIGASSTSVLVMRARMDRGEAIYTATAPVRIIESFYFELQLVNTLTSEVFSTYSEEVKVIRRSQTEAYKGAILELDLRSAEFQGFLWEGKQKVRQYYRTNCQAIVQRANRLSSQKAYLSAIGVLNSIPDEAAVCSAEIDSLTNRIYNEYAALACETYLQRAQAFMGNRDFGEATLQLLAIPPGGSCSQQVSTLVSELRGYQREIEQDTWQRLERLYGIELMREERRYRYLENLAFIFSQPNRYRITQQNTIVTVVN